MPSKKEKWQIATVGQIKFDTVLQSEALFNLLERKTEQYNCSAFIASDPIQVPHRFSQKQDIEITALLTATIAWGNRTSIIKNSLKLAEIMDNSPFEFICSGSEYDWKNVRFVHRTFHSEDLLFFFRALQQIYQCHGTLEAAFSLKSGQNGLANRIANFRTTLLQTTHLKRSEKHISNPMEGSAAKRLCMFLRWMVRKDNKGVDFGIWNTIPMSELRIPLDVHTGNVAQRRALMQKKRGV